LSSRPLVPGSGSCWLRKLPPPLDPWPPCSRSLRPRPSYSAPALCPLASAIAPRRGLLRCSPPTFTTLCRNVPGGGSEGQHPALASAEAAASAGRAVGSILSRSVAPRCPSQRAGARGAPTTSRPSRWPLFPLGPRELLPGSGRGLPHSLRTSAGVGSRKSEPRRPHAFHRLSARPVHLPRAGASLQQCPCMHRAERRLCQTTRFVGSPRLRLSMPPPVARRCLNSSLSLRQGLGAPLPRAVVPESGPHVWVLAGPLSPPWRGRRARALPGSWRTPRRGIPSARAVLQSSRAGRGAQRQTPWHVRRLGWPPGGLRSRSPGSRLRRVSENGRSPS
jgi:hypothetical protein